MGKDLADKAVDLDTVELIIHAIYDDDNFKFITNKYLEIFKNKNNSSIEEVLQQYEKFLQEIISDKFKGKNTVTEIKKLREAQANNAWRLKNRWKKTAIDSLDKTANKFIKREYDIAVEEYKANKKVTILKVKTPKELIEARKEYLKKWSSNIKYRVCDFPYLYEMSEKKILHALSQDIVLCVTDILMRKYDFDINKIIVKSPSRLAPGIFTPYKRGRKANALGVARNGDNFASKPYDTQDIDGKQMDVFYEFSIDNSPNITEKIDSLKLELINPETEKKAMTKIFLDNQDLDIIRYAYTYSHINSFSFYISDLMKYLRIADTKKNYERIEDKLIKLPYYTFYTETFDEKTQAKARTSFNLFSRTHIETDINGRRVVQITRAFVEEVEKASTELMYKKELDKLTLDQSRNLAYFLEGRRNFEISNGNSIKGKKFTFTIDFLKWYVHLSNKKSHKQNMQYIEEGFKEIMQNQFIIKKYEMNHSSFDVWFYEGIEKRKLLLNNTILSLPESTNE